MVRDLTRKQFVEAMKRHGWEPPAYDFGLGYWSHGSLHVSEHNYATHRAALAAFIEQGRKHDEREEQRRLARSPRVPSASP